MHTITLSNIYVEKRFAQYDISRTNYVSLLLNAIDYDFYDEINGNVCCASIFAFYPHLIQQIIISI